MPKNSYQIKTPPAVMCLLTIVIWDLNVVASWVVSLTPD